VTLKLLLRHVGVLSRLYDGFNQCICVLVDDEGGYRIVEGLLETSWSSLPVNATRQQLVFGKGFHRPIVVWTKLGLIDVCPGRNRPFELVKSLLRVLASTNFQPRDRLLLVRRAFGQCEAIGNDNKTHHLCQDD
jgi:hypothetical protein